MQAVIKDLSELSTSVAIASSIWLLRKKRRWARLRAAWAQRLGGGPPETPADSDPALTPAPAAHPASAVAPGEAVPAPPAVRLTIPRPATPRPTAARTGHALTALLEHIEVVEDSDWQVWEAAVASQRAAGRSA